MTDLDRRQFLARAGLISGYVLAVDGRQHLLASTPAGPPPPVSAGNASEVVEPIIKDPTADEPNLRLVDLDTDVLVAGGGMAGVCAALSAARRGARVVLIQDRSRLGGNASSEIRMHIVGADCHGSRPGWREGGLIEEIRLEDAVRNPHRAWELFDLTLYDLCQREQNLKLLLDTSVYRAEKQADRIAGIWARCDKTETIYRISARIFCDCTGDARLGLEAGAAFRTGREPRAEFDESLALEAGDTQSQGSSILFTARQHDRPMPYVAPPWARRITADDLLFRGIPSGSYEYGYWWIELGGTRDVIRDNEELRFELLRVVLGTWDWIKNSGDRPDSKNWALETVGMLPGKRESRRLEGAHIQTQQDLQEGWRERDDGVSIGGWAFDEHPPGGFDDWDQPPFYSRPLDEPYNVALEALYSRNVANLMMAGRNISNSHVAFTSTRVMATCACMGQAVGTAAALCVQKSLDPGDLRRTHMRELQQALLRDDQTVRGVVNQDPLDLARQAKITATESKPGDPRQVTDGHVRDDPGQWQHRFGAVMNGKPVALHLEWESAVTLAQVQITFDTGFHRELTLSASDAVTNHMVRGPQPETVSDYRLVARTEQGERQLAKVRGNYQRLRRHAFEPTQLTRLSLIIERTHGAKEARVFEIRCYA